MTATTTGLGVATRHLSWRDLVRDLVVLTLAGCLAAFIILFSSRILFDRVYFEAGLDYTTRAELQSPAPPAAAGLQVLHLRDVQASAAGQASGGSRLGDYERSRQISAFIYDGADRAKVVGVLGASLVEGEPRAGAVLVDEATAAALHSEIGGQIVLSGLDDGVLVETLSTVSGIVRPFHEPDRIADGGLVILDDDVYRAAGWERVPWSEQVDWVVFDPDPSVSGAASSHVASMLAVLRRAPSSTGFILGVGLVGLAVWILAVSRISAGVRDRLAATLAILLGLGFRASAARWGIVGLVGIIAVIASSAASLAAQTVTHLWTGFHVQTPHLVLVVVILSAVAMIVARLRLRRLESIPYRKVEDL